MQIIVQKNLQNVYFMKSQNFSYPYKATIVRYYEGSIRPYFLVHDLYIPASYYMIFSENIYISISLHIIFQRIYEIGYAHNDSIEETTQKKRTSVSYLIKENFLIDNILYCAALVILSLVLSVYVLLASVCTMSMFFIHNKRIIPKKISFPLLMVLRYCLPYFLLVSDKINFQALIVLFIYILPFALQRTIHYFLRQETTAYSIIIAFTGLAILFKFGQLDHVIAYMPILLYIFTSKLAVIMRQ